MLVSCQTVPVSTTNTAVGKIYKNIKIIESLAFKTGSCEPSIAINPMNPNNMVVGNVLNDLHYTFDGGKTWTSNKLQSDLGVFGDPCIIADSKGIFYYLHLADPDGKAYASRHFLNQIVLQRSDDSGKTWTSGTGIGKNEPTQQDKEWAVVHPTTGQIYVTWTEFDKYGSSNPKHRSRIRFSTSKDKGNTFSKAKTISAFEGDAKDDDYTTEGAVPAVNVEGVLYVSWAFQNNIYFNKSADDGETWMANEKIIAKQSMGWAQDIPGIGRCNGMPITAVDISDSEHKGTVYVNWTDQRNGTDNTDVFLIKSSDQGTSWSQPVKVNLDTTNTHQFFTWMSVDPVTGYIYIVYYDRSRFKDTKTDVMLAISKDAGNSFSNEIISESPFTPINGVFFGDYNNIAAYNGIVRPVWTRYEKGKLSVWTALIALKK